MNHSISILRVVAMLTIVFYHCLCPYGIWKVMCSDIDPYSNIEGWRAVCNVALHTFVLISGYLYASLYINKGRYREYMPFIKDKAKRLLIPYSFWCIPALAFFGGEHWCTEVLSGCQHLWFLLMLFGMFGVVSPLVKCNAKMLMGGVILSLIAYMLIQKYAGQISNYLAWKSVLRYTPTFLWAMMIIKGEWHKKMNHLNIVWLVVLFLLSVSCVIYIGVAKYLPLGGFYAPLPTYIMVTLALEILSRVHINSLPPTFRNIDRNSMGIYIIHHLLIWGFIIYVPCSHEFMNNNPILAPCILFVVVFVISWAMTIIINSSKLRWTLGTK